MKKRIPLLLAALATLVLVLSACQRGGVNADDAALIRQQLEDVASRLDVVEDRIDDLATEATGSEMLISQVRNELNQARTTLADVEDKLAPGADDGLADDGLGAPVNDGLGAPADGLGDDLNDLGNDLGNEAQDALDGAGNALDQLGDDVNEGVQDLGNDVEQGVDELQDRLDGTPQDGIGNDLNEQNPLDTPAPTTPGTGGVPTAPGTGGGANDSTPGLPATPGL